MFAHTIKVLITISALLMAVIGWSGAEEKRGAFALAFDDGYPSWISIVALELSAVGGVATGYVNNLNVNTGKISFDDLLALQNRYGWEIGTHTYSHYNPELYVRMNGLEAWINKELDLSINELRAKGLNIRSLVFPFNKSTPHLQAEVLKRVPIFRRDDPNAIADGADQDGSVPGRALDLRYHIPVSTVKKWIDRAHENNQILFIYGHQVLPDNEFALGEVAAVSKHTLVAKAAIPSLGNPYLCVAPDLKREKAFTLLVRNIEGNTIIVSNGDLTRYTKPGASFMVGPCWGLRLSDFREIIHYAAEKMYFKTISGAVGTAPPSFQPKSSKAD